MIEIRSRGGCLIKVDTSKGKHGLVPGQTIKITDRDCFAEVIGVGNWPSEHGLEKLWVREEDGSCSFIESSADFEEILYA